MKAGFLLLILLFPFLLFAQLPPQDSNSIKALATDSSIAVSDSIAKKDSVALRQDSVAKASHQATTNTYILQMQNALHRSHYINTTGLSVAKVSKIMPSLFNDVLFYVMLALLLYFAFLRFLFEKYFNTMFRVFFNTSLRQSQLTDQLLQSKQASMFFNILFVLTGGLYVYFLLTHFKWINTQDALMEMGICILCVGIVYFIKYLCLQFTGWITGYQTVANTYTFIIFLINKILGVLLVPLTIVIAFSSNYLQYPAVLVSLLVIGLMFFLRFMRSYSLLRKDVKVSRFHFFIYILGVEILPLLLIYKGLVVFFNKNL